MKVIKRNNYYYLGHSFRKDGKVFYKEKYLGKKIPSNIQEITDIFLYDCMKSVWQKLSTIKKNFAKEWKQYPNSIKNKILLDIAVDFTYNTNAIEGSTITLEETNEVLKRKISPNKPIDDVKETLNHANLFFKIFNEKRSLSKSMILEWHKELFLDTKQDIAGSFRNYLVKVGNYKAPDLQDLNLLLKDFFQWLEKNKRMNPIELSARAHYKFEKIHPFGDGNGRIGRLLTNFILKKNGYPILIIEHKKRKSYYHALSKSENEFLSYFVQRYLKSYNKYLK